MSGQFGDRDLDLPFEPAAPGTTMPLDDSAEFASGVVVMAATFPVPDVGPMPALLFRFARPDGSGFLRPVLLVLDEDQAQKLPPLVNQAVVAAVGAAGGESRG